MSGEHTHPDLAEAGHSHPIYALADPLAAQLAALQGNLSRLTAQVVALEAGQVDIYGRLNAMVWHDYSGKPDTTQTVPAGDYVRVDVDVADPPHGSVLEFHMLYANCVLKWRAGGTHGVIRVKYVREDGDSSAYQDYTVTPEAFAGAFLITAQHFEVGQAGMGGRWWIRCGGDLASIALTTRYVKIAQVG